MHTKDSLLLSILMKIAEQVLNLNIDSGGNMSQSSILFGPFACKTVFLTTALRWRANHNRNRL